MRSSAGVTNSHACCTTLPPRHRKSCHTSPRSLTHVANRSNRNLHICIYTQAAGAIAQADDGQHLSGDVVLQDGNLIHAAEVANVSKPILSGGGGGIFFFWQLGGSSYFSPKKLSQLSRISVWDLHPKAEPSRTSSCCAHWSKACGYESKRSLHLLEQCMIGLPWQTGMHAPSLKTQLTCTLSLPVQL